MKATKATILAKAKRVFGEDFITFEEAQASATEWTSSVRFYAIGRERGELYGIGRSRTGSRRVLLRILGMLTPVSDGQKALNVRVRRVLQEQSILA